MNSKTRSKQFERDMQLVALTEIHFIAFSRMHAKQKVTNILPHIVLLLLWP